MASFIAFMLSTILLLFGVLFMAVSVKEGGNWTPKRLISGFFVGFALIFASWGAAYLGGL